MHKIKLIAIFLIIVLTFSALTSCGKKSSETSETSDSGSSDIELDVTDKIMSTISKNVKISISSDMTEKSTSVTELTYFFEQAMSFVPEIVADTENTSNKDILYLALGKNNAMLLNNAKTSNYQILGIEELGRNGIALKTFDNVTCLYGYNDNSTVNAVYKFLEDTFGYEYFASDEYFLKSSLKAKWINFDYKHKLLIDQPCLMYKPIFDNLTNTRRLKAVNYYGTWISSIYAHSYFRLLPKSQYLEEHPEWYSDDLSYDGTKGENICYTRGGEEMINEMVKNIIAYIEADPTRDFFSICQEDSFGVCTCDSCRSEYNKFESENVGISYVNIDFNNKIVRKVNEWIASNCPERNITFVTFAYNATKYPPVKYNSSTGKYDPLIKAEENLNVQFVINFVDYAVPYTENDFYVTLMAGWREVASKISIWQYSTNFQAYLEPFENWGSMAANYKWLAENGVDYVVEQATHDSNATNFEEMRMYVMSQLCWGETDDTDYLVNKFLRAYYKDAYQEMRDIYDLTRLNIAVAMAEKGISISSGAFDVMQATNWSSLFLAKLNNKIDAAIERIEKYKNTDEALYNKLVQRIEKERLWINYWQLTFYSSDYPDFASRWAELVTKLQSLGINPKEGVSIYDMPNA